jgi:hypothetical protein
MSAEDDLPRVTSTDDLLAAAGMVSTPAGRAAAREALAAARAAAPERLAALGAMVRTRRTT